ncbi:MAG TPA: lipid A export permease/ATP-binding protein MsbA [Burkholderiaceae bacterium]|jgi:subfamily B ATP-binding cassette protein MsbA
MTPSPFLSKLRVLGPYFSGSHWAFVLAALGAAISGGCEAGIAWIFKLLVDNGLQRQSFPFWAIPLAIVALFLVRGLAGFVVDYTLAWSTHRATLKMRTRMFERVLDAHPKLFSTSSSSSLINTVIYEVLAGVQQLVGAIQTVLKDSFTVLGLLGMLLWFNWQLTLFIALLLPTVGIAMRQFSKRMHRITRETQVAVDKLAYVVEENAMAWRIVRLHAAQVAQRARFEAASAALRRLLLKSTVASATATPVTQLITACALAAIVGIALWQSSRGVGMTPGTFVAFITAAIGIATPLRRLSDVVAPISRGLASVERGMTLIEHAPREAGGTHVPPPPGRARGELALRDVAVRFGEAQALAGITLDFRAGETVALVGPSGAGKSTLVNLLPRFLDPSAGSITLDGVELGQWSLAALRAQFALVSQDVVLFNDSVAANVCVGTELDRERVDAALAAANLSGFVAGLPNGIDTPIGHNGTQLSGGQRQRMAIARAIYKDAPILILDEATSALDSESERLVQQALQRLMSGRTSIVIAHRLSTIELADRIIAIEAGRVVEQGSHAELLNHGGLYARLHALQFRS